MQMPLHPSTLDIITRLLFAMMAGFLIGLNRESNAHAAGLRTTILVCLAACIAMIQANILLSLTGKTPESFGVMDYMRLPLGVLTGVGFIGGGTILKKGNLIVGVTTAAILWIVTMIGLCFGGGQLLLGIGATFLCLVIVSVLKFINIRIPRKHYATLDIHSDSKTAASALENLIKPLGYNAWFHELRSNPEDQLFTLSFEISWRKPEEKLPPLDLLKLIEKHYVIKSFVMKESIDHFS